MRQSVLAIIFFAMPVVAMHGATGSVDTADPEQVVSQRIAFYNRTFPEIRFVYAEGGEGWPGELLELLAMIGDGAEDLDYRYPPEMREAVMGASFRRLRHVLEDQMLSATTYRVGRGGTADRPNLCIITSNLDQFLARDEEVMRYMLDLSAEELGRVHPSRHLALSDYVAFVVDHEAFHCIDSVLQGGIPMTQDRLVGEYYHFRRENRADAYALAAHIGFHGQITPFANNIALVRALWMYTEGPNHDTFESIRQIMGRDAGALRAMSVHRRVTLAVEVADRAVGSGDMFIRRRAAAMKAAAALGIDPSRYKESWVQIAHVEVDPAEANKRMRWYKYCYDQLFNDAPVVLALPDGPEN